LEIDELRKGISLGQQQALFIFSTLFKALLAEAEAS
jgi:hypothetical protein